MLVTFGDAQNQRPDTIICSACTKFDPEFKKKKNRLKVFLH